MALTVTVTMTGTMTVTGTLSAREHELCGTEESLRYATEQIWVSQRCHTVTRHANPQNIASQAYFAQTVS